MNFKQILQALSTSFVSSFTGKLWKWLLGSVGGLSAILLAAKNLLNTTTELSLKIGIFFLLGVFLLRFFLFFIYFLVHYFQVRIHESIYGEAIILLKDAFSKVHFLRKTENFDDHLFIDAMVTICNKLKVIFDRKTKAKCSVSIKVPISGLVSAETSVQNLCRDSDHFGRDTDKYKQTNHTILGNTAYQVVLSNIYRNERTHFYYLNNCVNRTENYQNTSRDSYKDGIFPYNSELVFHLYQSFQ